MEKLKILNFGLNATIETPTPWGQFHAHNEIELTFFLNDPVVYRFGKDFIKINPRETILFWGNIPHQIIEADKKVLHYWITIPPKILFGWNLKDENVFMLFKGNMIRDKDLEQNELDKLNIEYWSKKGRLTTEEAIIFNRIIEARIRLLFFNHIGDPSKITKPVTREKKRKNGFEMIYNAVFSHYKENWSIPEICKDIGLNSSYASTLFKKECGMRISDFITLLKVNEAQRLLITTDLKIIDIAYESGFGSVANFYSNFGKLCGQSPSEFRSSLIDS